MPIYRVSVYYTTRAYRDIEAASSEEASEIASADDWRDYTIADGESSIDDIEEIEEKP